MNFAFAYLAQLASFAARSALPRVRALHLPPAPCANDGKGQFCALELEDGSIGLSYALLGDDTLARLRHGGDNLGLRGADALTLAGNFAGAGAVSKTIGFAAANAISRCLFERAKFRPEDSADSVGHMNPQPGERVGMIGLFKPLLPPILHSGALLTVVELNADLAGAYEGYSVTLDSQALADCSKVVSTSTLLLNDTLDRMLDCCRNARWFAMIGPSAGCLPDALFARGVTLLGGCWIEDPLQFIAALENGEPHSAFTSKFALTRDNYPGFEALLARACE